jgi:hypothetical protein
MIASALHGAALGGALTILATGIDPAQHDTAIWGLVITSATGILTQFLRARAEGQREERRHRFELQDRKLAADQRSLTNTGLADNAALTRANGVQLTEQSDRVVRRIDSQHTPEPDPVDVLREQTAEQKGMQGINVAVPRPAGK